MENMIAKDWSLFMSRQGGGGGEGERVQAISDWPEGGGGYLTFYC